MLCANKNSRMALRRSGAFSSDSRHFCFCSCFKIPLEAAFCDEITALLVQFLKQGEKNKWKGKKKKTWRWNIYIYNPHTHIRIYIFSTHKVEILSGKCLSLLGSKTGHKNVWVILLESIHPFLLFSPLSFKLLVPLSLSSSSAPPPTHPTNLNKKCLKTGELQTHYTFFKRNQVKDTCSLCSNQASIPALP